MNSDQFFKTERKDRPSDDGMVEVEHSRDVSQDLEAMAIVISKST